MFEELYDVISFLWSGRWPVADGEITAIDVERLKARWGSRDDQLRIAVAYKFSIGEDGPYTGECFWTPVGMWNQGIKIRKARRRLHRRQRVRVRYRRDDPSVNTLAGGVRGLLQDQP